MYKKLNVVASNLKKEMLDAVWEFVLKEEVNSLLGTPGLAMEIPLLLVLAASNKLCMNEFPPSHFQT